MWRELKNLRRWAWRHLRVRIAISFGTATSLTDVLRDCFRPWSDPAESVNELTILLLQDKLKPIEREYAIDILSLLDAALPWPRT